MFAVFAAALSFSAHVQPCGHAPRARVAMNAPSTRRGTLRFAIGAASALLAVPTVAAAASSSPQQMLKSRAVYGSRVFRLQNASPGAIMEDKNVFTLFITGVYSAAADKPIKTQLLKLEKSAIAAATKGDAASAQAAVKEFVALAKIEELDMKPGSYYNAKSPCDRAGLQCGYQYEGYLGSRNDADLEKAARVAAELKAQAK